MTNQFGPANHNFIPRPPLNTPNLTAIDAIFLRVAHTLTPDDAADALGISLVTYYKRLNQIRERYVSDPFRPNTES